MEPTDPIPDNVRLTTNLPVHGVVSGDILCVEGRDTATGQLVVTEATKPYAGEFLVDWRWVEPVTVPPVNDFHVITERADGPDLDDLVRLIRYLRQHDIDHVHIGSVMRVEWSHPNPIDDGTYKGRMARNAGVAEEGEPEPESYFVGPDGTVYDANGEAL